MSERVRHDWTVIDSAEHRRGLTKLEKCLGCGRWRATIQFDAPQGAWLNLRAFLNDLDQLGVEYAATPEVVGS